MRNTSTGFSAIRDYTKIGSEIDSAFEAHNLDVRPTTLKLSYPWTTQSPDTAEIQQINEEKAKDSTRDALDWLDILSQSGALPLLAELHILYPGSNSVLADPTPTNQLPDIYNLRRSNNCNPNGPNGQ